MHSAAALFDRAVTICAAKSIRFKNKKNIMSNLKIVLKKVLEIKKIFAAAQPSAPNTSLAAPKRAARN
jgi:hypothetical protein